MPLHRHLPRLLPLLALAACGDVDVRVPGRGVSGSGTAAAETREVSGFHTVAYALPGQLTVVRGEREEVRIEADDNLLPLIETRVRDGVLEIGSGRRSIRSSTPLRVQLTARELRGVVAAGSGSVEAPGLRGGEVSVTVAGSGGVRAPGIQAERVRVEVAGSGSAELAGRAPGQVVTVAGSGNVRALELEGANVQVTIAGSGSARVHATERLSANIVGSGSVHHRGDPQVQTTRAGSGTVRRAD